MNDAIDVARARFEGSDYTEIVDEFVNQDGDRIFKVSVDHPDDTLSLTADGLNEHATVAAVIELVSYSAADFHFVEVRD